MEGITTRNPIMDVPELIPMEDYDPYKARLAASIRWLLTKAFGNGVPTDLQQPFYEDDKGTPQLTPALMNALTSSDLYCRACTSIFRADNHARWEGHWAVMQALSRKGIYVVDSNGSAVTETLLLHTQPFKVSAHLAMIESLMQAHIAETVSIERISQAVRRFSSFNASSELPYHTEEAIIFWVNKVCNLVRSRAQQELVQQDASDPIDIPQVKDLTKDLNDGCCLASLISFYCPDLLPLTEVAVKSNPGIADSLYNVQLVCDFCERHVPGVLPLTLNDLFYGNDHLRIALLAFLAEVFDRFEVNRIQIVRDTSKPYKIIEDTPSSPTRSKRRPLSGRPLISNATKKSFQQNMRATSASNPDLHNNAPPPPRQPLLPRRLGNKNNPHGDDQPPPRRVVTHLGLLRRSRSLTSIEDHDGIRDSVRAWEEQQHPADHVVDSSQDTGRTGSTMLGNVSMDSDMSLDLTTDSSIELSELEDTPRSQLRGSSAPLGPVSRTRNSAVSNPRPHTGGARAAHHDNPGHRGNPHGDGVRRGNNNNGQPPLEPLMPAKLKPAKEKTSNHTKEVESGEKPEKKSPSSPAKPRTLALKSNGGDDDSSSDEEFQTPSAENVPFFTKPPAPTGVEDSAREAPVPAPPEDKSANQTGDRGRGRQYEAFYVDTDNPPITSSVTSNGVPQPASHALDRNRPQAQSFTLHDHARTPEAAMAAGIPVVDGSLPKPVAIRPSSRDSVNSSKSVHRSREKPDQELSKLNADSRNKEIKDTPRDSFFLNTSSETVQRPDTLNVPKPIQVDHPGTSTSLNGDRPSPKTSFAILKQQKDSGEVSPVTYIQHGSPMKNQAKDNPGLKSAFHKVAPGSNPHGKPQKKTSFAALPNQTTWQESMHKSMTNSTEGGGTMVDSNRDTEAGDSVQPMATELLNIRMRLEERRRQIETEKRRMEMQWNKQRQRMGKQAFIAVITKGKSDGSSPEDGAAAQKKTPEGASSGLRGVTDSGLGGSQTEGESDTAARPSEAQIQQEEEARRLREEQEEKERLEREQIEREEREKQEREEMLRKERELKEERLQKEKEEKERKAREESERKERERQEREEQERLERERVAREEKEKELERIREREREKEKLRKQYEEREKERQRELEKEVELELEMERKRHRELEKDLELELEREKSRQRDLELERLREKQTMLEKQLEERLRERSESPSGSSDLGRSRTFSREGIQNLLDGGKQRWLSREGTPEIRSRPKSYAAGEGDLSDFQEPSLMGSHTMGGLAGAKAEYGQGLDRLNTSLTDLQGEIMRLSLEQDHLKNIATRVQSTPPKPLPSQSGQPPQQSRYYGMYSEPTGEPDIAGGIRSTVAGSTSTSTGFSQSASMPGHPGSLYASGQSGQFPPSHPMYGVQQHPSYIPPPAGQYGQYMPYQQQFAQGVPPPQPPQYPQHQGATTPLYHAPPGAPLYQTGYGPPPPGHQGQWPPHVQQHHYGPGSTSAAPGYTQSAQSMDYSSSHPAEMAQTQTTGAHHGRQMSPSSSYPVRMTASGGSGGHADGIIEESSNHESLPSSTHSLPGVDEASLLSPRQEALDESSSLHTSLDGAIASSPQGGQGAAALSISAEGEEADPAAENAGFFISFDADSPRRRQKPKLPSQRKKGGGAGAANSAAEPVKPPIAASESAPKMSAPPAPVMSPPRPVVQQPGVLLIIDADENEEAKIDMSDMEKRKQRILQQQMKRREEAEKKRLKQEAARARKEDKKREKQELAEQKKAEEKARRQDIFARYLMRKDQENAEDEPKPTPPIKKREKTKPKAPRPKSQPPAPFGGPSGVPGGGAGDDHSASSHSHSSQEDLSARGQARPGYGAPDQTDAGYSLAYGGLTHRRPPSPVWRKPKGHGLLMRRVLPGNKMHAESLPCRLDKSGQAQGDSGEGGSNTEYHGPKLFVKPSSKSNKNLIGNAISHCCLAGTVNNGIKNKILDEVERSEGKHFVILFRDGGQQFRSIYTYNPDREEVIKLTGTGPKQLHNKMMERFYKYNSGSKSFSEIKSTKHISVSIDAVTIQNHYWQKKPIVRKAGPNMY